MCVDSEGESRKKIIDDSELVEAHLLQRNLAQLQQANAIPFAAGDLSQYLGDHGEYDFVERALDGDYLHELNNQDPTLQAYLKGLQYSSLDIPDSVQTNLTLEEYKRFWEIKRETTATSPYGLHIGHYKAALEDLEILNLHMQLMIIPFKFGFAPKRWCKTVQIMLEKIPGSPWSHRLRIIELFDAKLNVSMQIFLGRRMVHNALEKGLVHPSAFGSVPGKNAQDALLEKELTIDMLRITRTPGALFDCDAKGCYDRILPGFSTLHTRLLGMPTNWAKFFSIFWRKCTHHIRTKFGISEKSFAVNSYMVLARAMELDQLYGFRI